MIYDHMIIGLRERVSMVLESLFSSFDVAFISYFYPHRSEIYRVATRIRKEKSALAKSHELFQLYVLVKATEKLQGDLAEVGVYRGTTAKMICEAKGNRLLHLFDTFEGLPKPSKFDPQFHERQYEATLGEVQAYLEEYPSVNFYKGLFPQETGGQVRRKRFSFVHLDVDLYKSTKEALAFFYPRMIKGGIIVSHDYVSMGVRKAFDEFFKGKPEPVIELPGIQVLVVKV